MGRMNNKGQSAVEFLMLLGFLMIFFLVLFGFLNQRMSIASYENKYIRLDNIGDYIRNEFEIASFALDGYEREFSLPGNLEGYDYNANVYVTDIGYLNELVLTYDDEEYEIVYILPANISVGGLDIEVELIKGANNIIKTDGIVYLNPE
ncbi:hypothetical protein ACFL1H_04995 [Nanoarchaeota archaeon]